MKVGIFGGTFDPIHIGHLLTAQSVMEEYFLDSIMFIPAKFPVHKRLQGNTTADDRMMMIQLAIKDNERFGLSEVELDRDSPSFTVITLGELQDKNPETEFHLLIGLDSFNEFHTWRDYERILRMVPLIVLRRPGFEADNPRLSCHPCRGIFFASNPLIEISSSEIRENMRTGKSIRYMVTSNVEEYILRQGLYGS